MSVADLLRAFGLTPDDVSKFDRKQHARTTPETKRRKRKTAHESRRRNRS